MAGQGSGNMLARYPLALSRGKAYCGHLVFFESGIKFFLGSFNVLFRHFADKISCFSGELCKF